VFCFILLVPFGFVYSKKISESHDPLLWQTTCRFDPSGPLSPLAEEETPHVPPKMLRFVGILRGEMLTGWKSSVCEKEMEM
jgi:hypothetical protein